MRVLTTELIADTLFSFQTTALAAIMSHTSSILIRHSNTAVSRLARYGINLLLLHGLRYAANLLESRSRKSVQPAFLPLLSRVGETLAFVLDSIEHPDLSENCRLTVFSLTVL
jgi:hypothetical protein